MTSIEIQNGTKMPDSLPRIIKIHVEGTITAAQKEDLNWIAWGGDEMGIREKINEIGPALDISYQANASGFGYLLWIEPAP